MSGLHVLVFASATVGLLGLLAFASPASQPASAPAAKGVADRATYLAGLSKEMEKTWPANRIVNVVCHGHSVPAGYFQTPTVDTFNAYPHLLHKGIKAEFPHAVVNVIVTAIGGENCEGGAARFDKDVLALHPDVVTIDYVLNDRGLSLEQSRNAWVSMIQKAQAGGVKVILLTPTGDTGSKLDEPKDPINLHAQQVRDLAAEFHVGLADSLEAFKGYIKGGGKLADLMSQSNHPNRKGHDLVTKELLEWFPKSEIPAK